jgi:lysine decarboxylase
MRIYDFLKSHEERDTVSFHMPGHKGSRFFIENGYGDFLDSVADRDITEISGADNLFQAEGIIRETEDAYALAYGTKKTHLLVGGSSAGIIAAIASSVKRGEKLLMARNSHKSVYNAVSLFGLEPVYLYPEYIPEYDVESSISLDEVRKKILANPDAKAIILPSPNYYGLCSDIKAIAEFAHKQDITVIVDEAHGAHLKFFSEFEPDYDIPRSAVDCGADLVINSIHKTLAAFTQSAVLHICTERVDNEKVEHYLQAIESTSPSYLLMSSLDVSERIVRENGKKLFADWRKNLEWFYAQTQALPGIRIMDDVPLLDRTKINIVADSLSQNGKRLDGNALTNILRENYEIYAELATGDIVMCMSGIGNQRPDFERLISTLKEISAKYHDSLVIPTLTVIPAKAGISPVIPHDIYGEKTFVGIPKETTKISLEESAGKICAAMITPYPPGIPILCQGERIDASVIDYIAKLKKRGTKILAVSDNNEITVGK